MKLKPVLHGGPLTDLPIDENLYHMFETHCTRQPDKVAIHRDHESISYRDFRTTVNLIANRLRDLGVQPQDRVAIIIPRSAEFVSSVFAVLNLEAVFVPLSIDEPEQRLTVSIDAVNAVAVIRIDASSGAVSISRTEETLGRFKGETIPIAYILHTSGSTGVPKGVVISRNALSNCLNWHASIFEVREDVCVSHLNLTSFDFIIAEVLLPLVVGGSMVIPRAALSTDVIGVIDSLSRAKVDVLQMVPTLMIRFLKAISLSVYGRQQMSRFADSGRMICNGEALPDSARRLFYNLFPQAKLYNCYGPTEACVAVTLYLCPAEDIPQEMYIGRPAPNVDLYVVDDDLKEVRGETAGELLIGGVQVAQGYVGDPITTAQKFIPIQDADRQTIVYRTGDLVQVSDSGLLRFIGRNDNQVKFRGLRLELGELEAAVVRSGLIELAKAVVTDSKQSRGRQQLVLFVTPRIVVVRDLERFLITELPADRRPSLIVTLDSFPVTDRGKLDSAELMIMALSEINGIRSSNAAEASSADNVELLLAAIKGVTGRGYLEDDLWPVAGMDSLGILDLELELLEKGLAFESHGCENHGITIRVLSTYLTPSH